MFHCQSISFRKPLTRIWIGVGADAWSLMYPSILEKLQCCYNDGYKLVIFTNESNIECWKNKRQVAIDLKIGRLENFIKLVKVPVQDFIACGLSSGQNLGCGKFWRWSLILVSQLTLINSFTLVMQLEDLTITVMQTLNLHSFGSPVGGLYIKFEGTFSTCSS